MHKTTVTKTQPLGGAGRCRMVTAEYVCACSSIINVRLWSWSLLEILEIKMSGHQVALVAAISHIAKRAISQYHNERLFPLVGSSALQNGSYDKGPKS